MAGVQYVVETVYKTRDEGASATAARVGQSYDGLAKIADRATGAFDNLMGKLFSVGKYAALAAGAGGVAALKVGLVDVNSKMEDVTIGLATIFRVAGAAQSFDQGLGMAKSLTEQIRQDAAALPGEFGDFVSMAQTLTSPLLNAGKGLEDIRNLTRDTVVSAAALGINFDQAAREMAMLLEGHAGGHNVLGLRLGINTQSQVNGKDFNKATAGERADFISKMLEHAKDSLPAFQRSWSGLTSTLSDNMKQLLGKTTAPLFERIKGTLWDLVGTGGLLERNQGKLDSMASSVGRVLVRSYDYAEDKVVTIAHHWHDIQDTTVRWGQTLSSALHAALPIVEKIGETIGHELQDPGKFLKELIAMRAGLAVASNAGSLVGGAQAAGTALGAGGAVGIAALSVAAIAAVGAFDAVTMSADETSPALRLLGAAAKKEASNLSDRFGKSVDGTSQMLKDLWTSSRPLVDLLGVSAMVAVDSLIAGFDNLTRWMRDLAGAAAGFVNWVSLRLGGGDPTEDDAGDYNRAIVMGAKLSKTNKQYQAEEEARRAAALAGDESKLAALAAKHAHKAAGGGKMNVMVNAPLQVLTDADPERIAKSVATIVTGHLKNPKTTGAMMAMRYSAG